jgi:hypothetical protein
MMTDLENSPDLTDEDVVSAVDVHVGDIGRLLAPMNCPVCGDPVGNIRHELRRRIPDHYWRIRMWCHVGHESVMVYRIVEWRMANDQMQQGSS